MTDADGGSIKAMHSGTENSKREISKCIANKQVPLLENVDGFKGIEEHQIYNAKYTQNIINESHFDLEELKTLGFHTLLQRLIVYI